MTGLTKKQILYFLCCLPFVLFLSFILFIIIGNSFDFWIPKLVSYNLARSLDPDPCHSRFCTRSYSPLLIEFFYFNMFLILLIGSSRSFFLKFFLKFDKTLPYLDIWEFYQILSFFLVPIFYYLSIFFFSSFSRLLLYCFITLIVGPLLIDFIFIFIMYAGLWANKSQIFYF